MKPLLTSDQSWVEQSANCGKSGRHQKDVLHSAFHIVVHVGETWFYLLGDGEHALCFPKGVLEACTFIQHKSHKPKVMFIVADSRPDASHQLDGKLWIWEVCCEKLAQNAADSSTKVMDTKLKPFNYICPTT